MHKVGENDTENDYSDEDSLDSEEKKDEVSTHRDDRQNVNRFNYQNNPYGNPNNNMYNGNTWPKQNNFDNMDNQGNYKNSFQNQNSGYSNNFNSNKTNTNNNQTEQDRACLVHCFFHELKMVFLKYIFFLDNASSTFLSMFFVSLKKNR